MQICIPFFTHKEQSNLNVMSVKYPQRTAEKTPSENYCLLYPIHTDGTSMLKLESFIGSCSVSWIHSSLGLKSKK